MKRNWTPKIVAVILLAGIVLTYFAPWAWAHGHQYPCPCCVPHTYEVPAWADATSPCVEAWRVRAQTLIEEARDLCFDDGGEIYSDWSYAIVACNDAYAPGTEKLARCLDLAFLQLGYDLTHVNTAYETEVVAIALWADYEISQCD